MCSGRPVEHTAKALGRATGAPVDAVAAELHREFAARVRADVVPRPGAVELLVALRSEGVPTALVTASPRHVADTVVKALEALGAGRFTITVTADDTLRTKPDPDPYLAACRALGVDPGACVAVEDTPTGVASAEAAGCAVLAVPSLAPIAPAPGRTRPRQPGGGDPGAAARPWSRPVRAAGDELEPLVRRYEGRRPPGEAAQGHRRRPASTWSPSRRRTAPRRRNSPMRSAGTTTGRGDNLGVISRYPITAPSRRPGRRLLRGDRGADPARRRAGGRAVWSAHLDYTPYGPYEARFDGLPAVELIAHEGVRLGQMREILRRIADSSDAGTPVLLLGDFNAPSHLDWPDVEWPVTKAAEEAGLRDSYREVHPDPVRTPATRGRRSMPSTRTAAGGPSRRTGSTMCCTGGCGCSTPGPSSAARRGCGLTSRATTGRRTTRR